MSTAAARSLARLLVLTVCLAACASPPEKPADLARYDRDLLKAHEAYHEGRLTASAVAYAAAAASAERYDDAGRLAPALLGMAAVALLREELAEARSLYRRAGVAAGHAGSPTLVRAAALGGAETARRGGNCTEARVTVARLLGEDADAEVSIPARLLAANCLAAEGEGPASLAAFEALRESARSRPDWLSAWRAGRAAAELASGELASAAADALEALALDRDRRHPPAIAADLRLLSEIAARRGDFPGAIDIGERSLRIYRQTGQLIPAAALAARLNALKK